MFNKKYVVAGITAVLLFGGGVGLSKLTVKEDNKEKPQTQEEMTYEEYKEEKEEQKEDNNNVVEEVTLEDEKVKEETKEEEVQQPVEEEPVKEEVVKEEPVKEQRTNLNRFLFVGDSFTVRIKRHITANNSDVYVHAKSSTMPSYWLDKVSEMPTNDKVDGVCLLIGVNGASRPQNLVDTKELINKLIAKYPDKKIYVQKVFPVGSNFENANPDKFNNSIKTYNTGLEEFCKTKENVYFIDTTDGFVENGYLIKDNGDGLHISESYDKEFYKNIEKEILNLINN